MVLPDRIPYRGRIYLPHRSRLVVADAILTRTRAPGKPGQLLDVWIFLITLSWFGTVFK